MQWLTVKYLVPFYTMNGFQNGAVSLSEPLNRNISSAPCTERVSSYMYLD